MYPDWGLDANVCPTCEKKLSTRRGMETHHTKQHSTKISFAVVECDECGLLVRKDRSVAGASRHHFCSTSCGNSWKRGREAPPDHNFRKDGKTKYKCEYCGEENEAYPSILEQGDKNFCDKECSRLWKKHERPSNEHNWWKGGPVKVNCETCGVEIERKPCKLERSQNFFCSTECEGKWKSENLRRENHPNWKGGHDHDYGPNWSQQRKKRLEQDNHECVVCSMSNAEHREQYGSGLHVHHIQRKENFRNEDSKLDYKRANRIENLVSLCYKCHGRWEGIPLRPQVN